MFDTVRAAEFFHSIAVRSASSSCNLLAVVRRDLATTTCLQPDGGGTEVNTPLNHLRPHASLCEWGFDRPYCCTGETLGDNTQREPSQTQTPMDRACAHTRRDTPRVPHLVEREGTPHRSPCERKRDRTQRQREGV